MVWGAGVATAHIRVYPSSYGLGSALVRDRDVYAVCLWTRGRTLHRTTCLHRSVFSFATAARRGFDTVGIVDANSDRDFWSTSFWNLCRLRDDLPERRAFPPHHGEVGCSHTCRNRNTKRTGSA